MYHNSSRSPLGAPHGQELMSENPPNVLNRLHALFGSNNAAAGPSRPRRLSEDVASDNAIHRSVTSPVLPVHPPKPFVDRDALVIKLVTWNMGDALPKGDLSVLLGDVPEYQPLETRDGLPVVPVGDSHPYHIIVVAGQECPTESGAPRGIGGGLMKGMKIHGLHHHKKGKDKDKEAKGSKDMDERDYSSDSTEDGRPTGDEGEGSAESAEGSRATTPLLGSTPTLHRHGHTPAAVKGWSSMLDDWLCGTLPKSKESEKSRSIDVPSAAAQNNLLVVEPPSLNRSASAPMAISSSVQSGPPNLSQLRSPLARSPSSFISSRSMSDSDSSASEMEASFSSPLPAPLAKTDAEIRRANRPQIVIPTDEPPKSMEGTKCYIHLTKQRLMGMYLSVYVHKDCRHLVSGIDKDFVTAGLAGGRLGNKGGIGISMNIADHRMLFVNSHLAAHTGRNAARMSNIAKIKSELSLDCFLPKDDPRASAKDLTDRFDSVFWCGDLNFRLDVARLHAEWLVEQKKYEEALTWDQLRNAMMDPSTNPLTGFEEGIIDFPPTFKYDVWKSVKTTNKNLRRSLRRHNSISKPRPTEVGSVLAAPKILDHVPEADTEDVDDNHSRVSFEQPRSPELSRRSYESSRSVSAATADTSYLGNSLRDQAEINGMMNSHRPLDVKLKEKTKQIMQLVKIRTHLSPSPATARRQPQPKLSAEFDQTSRRTSMSSLASMRDRETSPDTPAFESRPFGLIDSALLSPIEAKSQDAEKFGMLRRPSVTSSFGSPQRPGRAFSLKRTLSGKSMKMDSLADDSDTLDMGQDRREGVYDSSKKQRVPSWCDRVLWKAHPIPDLPESASNQIQRDVDVYQSRPRFGRLSGALANIGVHLKSPISRTMSIEPSPSTRTTTPPLVHSPNSISSPNHTLINSPPTSPGYTTPTGNIPPPKLHSIVAAAARTHASSIPTDNPHPTSPKSPVRHPLLQREGSQSGSPARPRITIDPSSTPSHDHVPRPRANSDTISATSPPKERPSIIPMRRLTGEPAPAVHTEQPNPADLRLARERSGSGSGFGIGGGSGLRNWGRSLTLHPDQAQRDGEKDEHHRNKNAFTRFIHDIPNWLHRHHGSTTEAEVDTERSLPVEDEVQRRHLKGEVVCLHYGTIDDAGMRLLEGRSDHRPAIFAAAIYI